jgi:hypothetical protein
LRKLAGSFSAVDSGAAAAEITERINALPADLLLDAGVSAGTSGEVSFIEAAGADRVKIGVASDVNKRFGQLAASFPGPLKLLGRVICLPARQDISWKPYCPP